jgi:hypothetical protein
VGNWPRQSWLDAEPDRLRQEREEMGRVAPEMEWLEDDPAGGWEGLAPVWPFERPAPRGLDELLGRLRLRLRVVYAQGYPMVEPKVFPLDPDPPRDRRILHSWHLNGDGSLCLLQNAADWTGRDTAADLVAKASGWFIEYLLMERGLIETMTESGIHSDDSLDAKFEELAP